MKYFNVTQKTLQLIYKAQQMNRAKDIFGGIPLKYIKKNYVT